VYLYPPGRIFCYSGIGYRIFWSTSIDKLLKLRIQESAASLVKYWWLAPIAFGGIALILFSQLKFSTDHQRQATVLSLGTEEGITGRELVLTVKTEDEVTTRVKGKGPERVGDEVTLNVSERILFSDVYHLD